MTVVTPVTPALLQANPLPRPKGGSKDSRGRVLIVGGCTEVPGAILLAAEAAMRSGAGKLQMATCGSVAPSLGLLMPEALVLGLHETPGGGIAARNVERVATASNGVDALLVGPGMMEQPDTGALTGGILERLEAVPAVLDAGALDPLPEMAGSLRRHEGRLVITPHAGEMAKLLGRPRDAVEADPLGAARDAAGLLHCVVVMKGEDTHVVAPDGTAWLFTGGTVGLATSGSGDVLAGVITALLARGTELVWAAVWGVFLHGEAGRRCGERCGETGFLAREVARDVPLVMRDVAEGRM